MSQELTEGLMEVKSDIKNILFMQAQTHGTVAQIQQDQSGYQAKSADERQAMAVDIGVIKSAMLSFNEYQKKCEADRLDLDKRVDKTENFQNNQKKIVAAMAAGISFLVIGGSKVAEKVIVWFS